MADKLILMQWMKTVETLETQAADHPPYGVKPSNLELKEAHLNIKAEDSFHFPS